MRKLVLAVALSLATLAGSAFAANGEPEQRPRNEHRGEVRSQERRPMIQRRRHHRRVRRIIRRHRRTDSRPHTP